MKLTQRSLRKIIRQVIVEAGGGAVGPGRGSPTAGGMAGGGPAPGTQSRPTPPPPPVKYVDPDGCVRVEFAHAPESYRHAGPTPSPGIQHHFDDEGQPRGMEDVCWFLEEFADAYGSGWQAYCFEEHYGEEKVDGMHVMEADDYCRCQADFISECERLGWEFEFRYR